MGLPLFPVGGVSVRRKPLLSSLDDRRASRLALVQKIALRHSPSANCRHPANAIEQTYPDDRVSWPLPTHCARSRSSPGSGQSKDQHRKV
jgi:hypothetical protein